MCVCVCVCVCVCFISVLMFRLAHSRQFIKWLFSPHCHWPPLLILRPPMTVQGHLKSYYAMLRNRIIGVRVCKSSLVLFTAVIKSKTKDIFILTSLFIVNNTVLSSAWRLTLHWVMLSVLNGEHLTRVNRVHSYHSELVKPTSLTWISLLASSHLFWINSHKNLWPSGFCENAYIFN